MTITYHGGNIIRGTSTDRTGGTWTNLQAGYIFLESDTKAIYYWDGSVWSQMGGGTEITGTATGAANGSATVFNIAHGLGATPYTAFVIPSSVLGSTINYSYTYDATNIVVTFASAPATGTITFQWRVVA